MKHIVRFILAALLCNCQGNTTSSTESEGNVIEYSIDSDADSVAARIDTIKYFEPNDPLFGECAEYLNACVLESDKEAIKEYNEDASSLIGLYSAFQGRWHLIKIETVDGSPIDESTMRALEKVTFGCGKDHYVVNGNLTLPWDNMKSLNLDSMRRSHTFVDNYSAFVTYFEKSYSEMGVLVPFDNVKVICTHDCTSSWLKYFSICDFALIGDDYHCCLVINQKYVLWFSQYKVLVTEYALEKYPRDPKDHFFEDPVSDLEGVQIDTKRRIIASKKRVTHLMNGQRTWI